MSNKKTSKTRRDERFNLLLTKHEKEALDTHAAEIGESANTVIRRILSEKIPGFVPAKELKR